MRDPGLPDWRLVPRRVVATWAPRCGSSRWTRPGPSDTASTSTWRCRTTAGGRDLYDEARAFWVLADPEGNEACICTWQDRG